ncbi:MAG: TolC family protein, partial [Magnetococcales bacterium]|nr:TolC family protein [Magnetococcales bacterium]
MKQPIRFSWVLSSLLPLLLAQTPTALAAGTLQEEIFKTMTPTPEEKIGPWPIMDAVKISLENESNADLIMAKGMREVAAGEYQEKSGAFNPLFTVTGSNTEAVDMPVPPWVRQQYADLKATEATLPGGSAAALIRALTFKANNDPLNFTATDLKDLTDAKALYAGLTQAYDGTIEKRKNTTAIDSSVKKYFREGVVTELKASIQRTDPINYNELASNGPGAINVGIAELKVTVPLLRNSGSDAFQATVDEKDKKLGYEAKQQEYRHAVSNRVRTVAKAYWDYKAAMEKQDILRVSEKMVTKWAEAAKDRATARGNRGNKDEVNTLTARLASESLALEEGKSKVYETKNALAEAMGFSVDELTAKGYPSEEFPKISANFEDKSLIKRLMQTAQGERADLKAAKLTEDQSNVQLTKAKKDLLPKLTADGTVGMIGGDVSGSHLSNVAKGFTENTVGPNWRAGLTFEYPFGNDAAEGMVKQRSMAVMRDSMLLEEKTRTVQMSVKKSLNDLKHAIPSVELAQKSIRNYWPSVEGSLEKYNAQRDRLTLSTLMDLLSLEEKLKDALTKNIEAKSALAKSVVDVRFTTGTLLPPGDTDNFLVEKKAILT